MSSESLSLQLDTIYYLSLVAFAILYYDYLLTVHMEVERFWKCSCTWAAILFYINRYIGILGHIPIVLETFSRGVNQIYSPLQTYHQMLAVILQIVVGALFIMRTYALYDKSKVLLRFLIAYVVAVVCVGGWALATAKSDSENKAVTLLTGLSEHQGKLYSIIWAGLLIFDVMVFGLTLSKALTTVIGLCLTCSCETVCMPSLMVVCYFRVTARLGTLYFIAIAAANLSNIITFYVSPPLLKGVVTTFTNAISTSLASRLMLNVRDPVIYSALRKPSSASYSIQRPVISTVIAPYHTSTLSDSRQNDHERNLHVDEPSGTSDIELVRRSVSG